MELWEAAKRKDVEMGIEIHHRLPPLWRAMGKGDMPARVREAPFSSGDLPVEPGAPYYR